MRTEIDHQYKWGFLLSEQELRRIAQSGQEHAPKVGARATTKITAKLKDGALIESDSLDDVLSLENGGQKAVTRLSLQWDDGEEKPKASIMVQFEDGEINPKTWDSISISVIGESRDAVFVAAADLEERVKKARILPWPYFIGRPWFLLIPLFIGMALSMVTSSYLSPEVAAVDQLQREYTAGRVKDPIQALILLERAKASPAMGRFLATFMLPFLLPYLLFAAVGFLAPKLTLSYVFYWGDSIARYDKRQNAAKIFWTVVVLGILVSVVGGLILRAFS